MTEIDIKTERVDDIALLMGQQQKLGLAEIIDRNIIPNGHRQGLSVGQTIEVWLSFILSESDHRLSYVEPWVVQHLETLRHLTTPELKAADFDDDRLGDVLRYLSRDQAWQAIEQALGQRTIQVYELPTEIVRLDSTSVAVHHAPEGTILIRHGHSKDHRPDLAQVKVMLASLDPAGMPLVTQVVGGQRADDGLYVPAITEVRQVLAQSGLLYVGDSKMEALTSRGYLVAGGDHYLTPLSLKGTQADLLAELVQPVLESRQELVNIYRAGSAETEATLLGQGYETSRVQQAQVEAETVAWHERILVVYSPNLADSARRGLTARLARAEEKLLALTPPPGRGRRQYETLAPLQGAAAAILHQHRVEGLLQVSYQQQVTRRQVRPYRDRPARTEEKVRYQLQVSRTEAAIETRSRLMGWRLYVTNAPTERFSLVQAVQIYRGAPTIERNFSRLKGRPLGLRPVYLHREDHLIGLVRLLSLALRLLSLMEFVVRRSLAADNDGLAGLYPGNPPQQTQRPTAERLLAAFKNITLSVVQLPEQTIVHITPLTPLQNRILTLLGLSATLYSDLGRDTPPNPP
jgi:transposase